MQSKKITLTYVAIFGALICFYAPVFSGTFGYLNDYTAFLPLPFGFMETMWLFRIGRPLQAILENIQFRFLGDMLSLQMMRIFIVLTIGAAAILFFRYVKNNIKINMGSAALLALLIFILPSMTLNSVFIAQSIPGIVPVFFVLFAHAVMQKSRFSAGVLIFLSLCTYPPATFFFLTLTFIKFVFGTQDSSQEKLKNIYNEVILFFVVCITYFLCIKFLYNPLFVNQLVEKTAAIDPFSKLMQELGVHTGTYAFAVSFKLWSKIGHIIDLFILDFSAWFPLLNGMWIIPLFMIFISIVTWASFSSPYLSHLKNSSKIIVGITISILIPLITAMPVLVIQGDFPMQYRILFASMAATMPVAIIFIIDRVLLIEKRKIIFLPVLGIVSVFIIFAIIASHYRLTLTVSRLSAEYQHVFDAVSQQKNKKIIRITPFSFSVPPGSDKYLYRDFGYTSVDSATEAMARAAMQSIDATERTASIFGSRTIDGVSIVYDAQGPRYHANISDGISFGRAGYPDFISRYKGIAGREAWGRWTDGEEALIEFVQPLPRKFVLKIKAAASPVWVGVPVKIIIGKTQIEATFNSQEATEVAFKVTTDGKARSIVFKFPDNKSPKELGLGEDPRYLGLGLIELQIKEIYAY